MATAHLNARITALLTDLEKCQDAGDRALLRETVRLLRDSLREREDEVRQADGHFRLAIDAAGVGVWDWDLASGRVAWNSHQARIFGVSLDTFEGTYDAFLRCVHLGDRDMVDEWYRSARATGGHFDHNFRVSWPDGQVRWVRSKGGFHFDAAGVPVRMLGTSVDITNNVDAQRLAESECRYRTLVEHSDLIIARFDRDLRHTFISAAVEKATGHKPEYFLGKSNRELGMPDRLCSLWDAALTEVFKGGKVMEITFDIPHPDGPRYYRSRLVPECNDAGDVETVMSVVYDVTELGAAQSERDRLHRRLEALMEALPVGVSFSEDATCRHITGNREVLAQFKVRRDDNLSASAPDATAPGRQVRFFRDGKAITDRDLPLQRAVAEDRVIEPMELEVHLPDGRVWFADASGAPIRDDQGIVIGGVSVTIDVTARKRVEEELRRTEERLAQSLAAGRVMAFEWTLASDEVIRFGTARELLGLSDNADRGTGRQYLSMVHQDDRAGLNDMVAGLARQPDHRYTTEYRLVRPDGSTLWVHETAQGVFDPQGRLLRLMGMTVDINSRKLAEQELEQTSQRLNSHMQNSPLAVVEFDTQFRITRWTEGAERLFGWTAGEIVGRQIWELPWIHPDDRPKVEGVSRHLLTGSSSRNVNSNRNVRKDGTIIFCEWYNSALHDEKGNLLSIFSLVLDVSERVHAEESLRQAKQAAEEANSAKDHFLAVLSHELRTPLAPVLATAHLLETDAALPEQHREMAKVIRRNVELEARLIDDLLDLTKIARGKLELHPVNVDLHEQIRQVVAMCADEISSKNLAVILRLDAPRHCVVGDSARLQQALWNLVKNAAKFTPPGGRITLTTANDPDDRITLEVADSGVGIAPDALPRIFDAFEQGHRSVTRQFGGLGLGLAITRALVEMHKGTITALSGGPGRGATFVLRLPGGPDSLPSQAGVVAAQERRLSCSMLLVDDHADTRRVMAQLLTALGCQVQSAGSVAEALALADTSHFDLVVSDIGLPDASGYDLMRQLKSRYGMRGVALSGYGMEEDMAQSRQAGFEAHLTKPVNVHVLEATVRRLVGG